MADVRSRLVADTRTPCGAPPPAPPAQLLPDLYYMAQKNPEEEAVWSILGAFFSTAFTLLQLYWSYLILKQILKGGKKSNAPRKAPPGYAPDEWEEEYQELQPPREEVARR